MNPSKSAQDVLRCNLCETPVPPLCCEICQIYLCKMCAGEHILDESTGHKVVPIKQTLAAFIHPTCSNHSTENCQLYCEDCTIPACVNCVTSKEHRGHGFIDLWPFSQKFLRSIMLVRENLRFCSFSQKFLQEYLRVKSVVTLRQF